MRVLLAIVVALMASAAIFASLSIGQPSEAAPRFPLLTPSATRTPTASPTPRATPTPLPRNEPAVGPGIMVAECIGTGTNSVRAFLLWHPSRGGRQWIDLSIFNNGFAPGTFIGVGGFSPDRYAFIWDGLMQGTTHYARVNTLTPLGWMSSQTLQFYTPVCDPAAYEPQPAADMLQLHANIEAAIASSGINTAVAITDLRTGETIDVNGRVNRLPGCTINLFALMRVVVDLQNGRYPEPRPGDLIAQTINRSDPITARALMKDWIGGGDILRGLTEVNAFMHGLGMNDTLMDHPPAFWHEALYGPMDNRITARDANIGLKAIWDGRVLTPGWRDYLLYKMTLVKPGLNYLIPVGTSAGATVSHKNGFLWAEGWADNDIGIVWFERGGQRYGYAISFFTQNVRNKYDDVPLGQRISSMTYQWFVGRYGYP